MSLAGLRIGLLTASTSRLGGGVAEAVAQHAALIQNLGGEPHVFALADRHSDDDRARLGETPLTLCMVRGPGQIGFAPGLLEALVSARLDCLHLHGIWMYPSRAGLEWARRTRRPYLISPHGMLDPWITSRGRWKKALARAGYERASWRQASALHALTEREAGDIARETGRTDSVVIPNPAPPSTRARASGSPRPPDLVYIGRIHPKKNLLALVEAWSLAARPADARLRIAGWGAPADVATLEHAIAAAGPSVEFLGPVFAEAKGELLGEARFTILPSQSEGLPLAILESWATGTPTIMTAECNLPQGFAAGAAIECGYEPAAIAAAIEQALQLPEPAWSAMSDAADLLVQGPFSASCVASRWSEVYRAIAEPR